MATGTSLRRSVPAPGSSTNGPKAKRDPCMRRIYSPFGSFWNYLGELNYDAVRILQNSSSFRSRAPTLEPYGGCHERYPCVGPASGSAAGNASGASGSAASALQPGGPAKHYRDL